MKIASCEGQLVKWKDDRGFGFIKPNGDNKEIFLHISALKGANRRPKRAFKNARAHQKRYEY